VLAIVVALVVTSLLALLSVWRVTELSRTALADHAGDRFYAQELRLEMERIVSADRAFMLTGDFSFHREMVQRDTAFANTARILGQRIQTEAGRRLFNDILEAKAAHSSALAQAIEMHRAGADIGEVARFFEQRVQPHTEAVRAALDAFVTRKHALMEAAARSSFDQAGSVSVLMIALAVINLALAVAILVLIMRTLRQLGAYAADLRAAVRARDEFLAVAGHELRTPLAVLKMHAQMMKRRLSNSEAAAIERSAVERLAAQVDRGVTGMALLVDRMLDISNIDRGQLVLSKEEVDLAALVADVLDRLQPVLADARCEVRRELHGPVVGRWDRQRLEQVVSNLLMNVVRHACAQPASVEVRAEGGKARLTVADQGPGIAKDQQARLFERFERGALTADGTGMGLGLAVSRELVRAHGGRIWVDSEPGRGARFTVELPCGADDQEPAA
jgi:signal transduction histidine kinase